MSKNSCIIIYKMRIFNRPTVLSAVRSTMLITAAAYIMQPLTVHAASVKVCSAAGDACSNFVNKYINPFILLLTTIIGIAAVISIIVAAIQYSAAGDDPGAVNKAKDRIFQTVIGIIAYIFLFAFLNYIIPGGILK